MKWKPLVLPMLTKETMPGISNVAKRKLGLEPERVSCVFFKQGCVSCNILTLLSRRPVLVAAAAICFKIGRRSKSWQMMKTRMIP